MSEQSGGTKSVTAIIIDDDDLMRRVIVAALTALECEIVGEADDGKQGLALFQATKPDLVLLDIRMPEMDGLEALKELEKLDEDAYVVMMTSMDDDESIEDAMIGGAKDYLRKNMSMNEMVARLGRHVTRLSQKA